MPCSSEKRAGEWLKETPKEKRRKVSIERQGEFSEYDTFEWEPEREGAESDALWENCTKNPGHEHFVPITEFGIRDLPSRWRKKGRELVDFIKTLADLTVRLRDDGKLQSEDSKTERRVGTGFIYRVEPTPPSSPRGSRNDYERHKSWTFYISTAKHVVYNTINTDIMTRVDFFYDSIDAQRNGTMVTLKGERYYDLSDEEECEGEDVGYSDDECDSDNEADMEECNDEEEEDEEEDDQEDVNYSDEEINRGKDAGDSDDSCDDENDRGSKIDEDQEDSDDEEEEDQGANDREDEEKWQEDSCELEKKKPEKGKDEISEDVEGKESEVVEEEKDCTDAGAVIKMDLKMTEEDEKIVEHRGVKKEKNEEEEWEEPMEKEGLKEQGKRKESKVGKWKRINSDDQINQGDGDDSCDDENDPDRKIEKDQEDSDDEEDDQQDEGELQDDLCELKSEEKDKSSQEENEEGTEDERDESSQDMGEEESINQSSEEVNEESSEDESSEEMDEEEGEEERNESSQEIGKEEGEEERDESSQEMCEEEGEEERDESSQEMGEEEGEEERDESSQEVGEEEGEEERDENSQEMGEEEGEEERDESSQEMGEEEGEEVEEKGGAGEGAVKKMNIMTKEEEKIAEYRGVKKEKEEDEWEESAEKDGFREHEKESKLGKMEREKGEEEGHDRSIKQKMDRSDEKEKEIRKMAKTREKLRIDEEWQIKGEMAEEAPEETNQHEDGSNDVRKRELCPSVIVKVNISEYEENSADKMTKEVKCVRAENEETVRILDANVGNEKKEKKEENGLTNEKDEEEGKKEAKEDEGDKESGKASSWDIVKFTCVTKQEDLFDKVRARLDTLDRLRKELGPWVQQLDCEPIIFISHPHGKPKVVTCGELYDDGIEEVDNDAIDESDASYYSYTTPTCPGSSGAFALRWWGSCDGITHCQGRQGDKGNRGHLTSL